VDQKHKVRITIPKKYYAADGAIHIKFQATFDQSLVDESLGIDNIVFAARRDCFVGPVCVTSSVVSVQDFENGKADGWSNGKLESSPLLTTFLGRFGKGDTNTSRTFDVPKDVDELTIEYDMYEIDSWDFDHKDSYYAVVEGKKLEFGIFGFSTQEKRAGEVDGIRWTHTHYLRAEMGFSSIAWQWMDEKHAVVITIPRKYYADDGKITVQFVAQTNEEIPNESLGIDNVKIRSHNTCPIQHAEEMISKSKTGDTCHVLDFERDSRGKKLGGGAYIKTEWAAWGVTVTASGKDGTGYVPENQARIFDTAFPGTNNDNGDPDLGSPNINCIPSTKRAGVSSNMWCAIPIWACPFTSFFVLGHFPTAQLGRGRRRRTWPPRRELLSSRKCCHHPRVQ
jgi:hypothetical protein